MASLRQLFGLHAPYASPRPGLLAALAVLLPLLSACESESLIPPPAQDPAEVYWSLGLDHQAVTLSTTAPYDTLTVTATPRNVHNEPLTGLPRPLYESRDREHVLVTREGLVVGVASMSPGTVTRITATLTVGNLKHQDSAWVTVVDNPTPPVLGTLSAHPMPPEVAKISAVPTRVPNWFVVDTLPVRVTDTTGAPMEGLLMSWRSSDTTRLFLPNVINGQVVARLPGTADVYVSATAFGVHRADTVTYRIGYPMWTKIHLKPLRAGSSEVVTDQREVRIGKGGIVFFNAGAVDTSVKFDIRFDDPTSVLAFDAVPVFSTPPNFGVPIACSLNMIECNKGGSVMFDENFPSLPVNGAYFEAARAFPTSGTYPFQSSAGFRGQVIVVDEE